MKLTKQQLKQLIKEELQNIMQEQLHDRRPEDPYDVDGARGAGRTMDLQVSETMDPKAFQWSMQGPTVVDSEIPRDDGYPGMFPARLSWQVVATRK